MRKLATIVCLLSVVFGTGGTGPHPRDYFTPVAANAESVTPDNEGFIRRWMLLEPISKPNRGRSQQCQRQAAI